MELESPIMFLSQKNLSVKQEEDNFYDVSLHENELGPSSPAEESGFAVGKNCTLYDLTIFVPTRFTNKCTWCPTVARFTVKLSEFRTQVNREKNILSKIIQINDYFSPFKNVLHVLWVFQKSTCLENTYVISNGFYVHILDT